MGVVRTSSWTSPSITLVGALLKDVDEHALPTDLACNSRAGPGGPRYDAGSSTCGTVPCDASQRAKVRVVGDPVPFYSQQRRRLWILLCSLLSLSVLMYSIYNRHGQNYKTNHYNQKHGNSAEDGTTPSSNDKTCIKKISCSIKAKSGQTVQTKLQSTIDKIQRELNRRYYKMEKNPPQIPYPMVFFSGPNRQRVRSLRNRHQLHSLSCPDDSMTKRSRSESPGLAPPMKKAMAVAHDKKPTTTRKLTLGSLKEMKIPKFVQQTEQNYDTAIIKPRIVDENPIGEHPIAVLERLSTTARFLKTYDLSHMIPGQNGEIILTELKRGRPALNINILNIMHDTQATSVSSLKPRRLSPKLMLFHIILRNRQMHERSPLSIFHQHYYRTNRPLYAVSETKGFHVRSYVLTLRMPASSFIRAKLKEMLLLNGGIYKSTTKNTKSQFQKSRRHTFVRFAKHPIAKKKTAVVTYDAESAANLIPPPIAKQIRPYTKNVSRAERNITSPHARKAKITTTNFLISSPVLRNCHQINRHVPKNSKRWHNSRLEEAMDKIFRLPPPGNGNQKTRQQPITQYFSRIVDNDTGPEQLVNQQPMERPRVENNHNRYSFRILQWNACSMNMEKRSQLELLANRNNVDMICVSELGKYRKINGFPNYHHCDMFTQSGIFWKEGLDCEIIETALNRNYNRAQTQCVIVAKTLLIKDTAY